MSLVSSRLRTPSRLTRALLAVAVVATGTLVVTRDAAARFHLHLHGTTPPDGSHLAATPASIQFFFSEKPELRVTTVTLSDAKSQTVPLSSPQLAPGADTTLVVNVKAPLAPGTYEVRWSTMASDGHPQRGHFGFTVDAAKS